MIQKARVKIYKLLRWSEQYTKTDMVYLAKGGFWLTLGQIISAACSFLLAIAFANLLPKEIFGNYKFVLSLASILSAFTLTGMNTAVAQAAARCFEGMLKKTFWLQIRWGLLMSLASLLTSIYYLLNNNTTLGFALLIVGAFSPILYSANTYTAFLSGKQEFKKLTFYGIAVAVFSALIIFITIFFTKNIVWLIAANIISNTTATLFFYNRTLNICQPNQIQDPQVISYSKHLSLINIVVTIATYLDGVLLFHFLGAAPLAIYSFASAIPNQIKGISKNIATLIFPKLAQCSLKEIDSILYERLRQLFLIGITIAGVYILIAPYFFQIFFPKYIEAIHYTQLYALTVIFLFPLSFFAAIGQAKLTFMPKNFLYKSNLLLQILLIILLLLLTSTFGIIGAIYARLIFLFCSCMVNLIFFKKMVRLYND